jgi:asparagine synthase (glutamine-hydrolysing)
MLAWADQPLERFLSDPALASDEDRYYEWRKSAPVRFLFDPAQSGSFRAHFEKWDEGAATNPLLLAREIEGGAFRYFGHQLLQTGFPPDWHANPLNPHQVRADTHWTEIDDFSGGDIKVVWEPNRFGVAYTLVRAYWRTGDDRYAELFWQCVEDWHQENPPQRGPNWKCGQEISFRLMAWCFGLYGFLGAKATTAARVALLAQTIGVSAERVQSNVAYALSQRNNHSISEAVGLWTVGVLFPEFRLASKWRELGTKILEAEAQALIYDDGSFAQHSMNYHRLMLHDYLWVLRLAEINDISFSRPLRMRIEKVVSFLYEMQDSSTGRVPNYGHNDGALILPLTNCDFRDFRPTVQAGHYVCQSSRCFEGGAWDEELFWLCGPEAVQSRNEGVERQSVSLEVGGYYTLRSTDDFAFVRCVSKFQHRPGQADILHMDLWWRGQNLALDAGTYSYNAEDPWNNPLGGTEYHNTVTVDDLDQMERVGKFIWLPWLQGRVRKFIRSGEMAYWEGEHDGYLRLKNPVTHRRGILMLSDGYWLVLDQLRSKVLHSYRLHWLFADVPYEWDDAGDLALATSAGDYFVQLGPTQGDASYSLVRADETTPRGWWAPYYNSREPALSVAVNCQAESLFFWTVFGPEKSQVTVNEDHLTITTGSCQRVVRLAHVMNSLASSVITTRRTESVWEIL